LGVRTELRMEERALRHRWGLTPEQRQEIMDCALEIVRTAPSRRDRIAAMRVLVHCDEIDRRREAQEAQAQAASHAQQASVLKQLLATPGGADALCSVAQRAEAAQKAQEDQHLPSPGAPQG
jgi:hypothetical protein